MKYFRHMFVNLCCKLRAICAIENPRWSIRLNETDKLEQLALEPSPEGRGPDAGEPDSKDSGWSTVLGYITVALQWLWIGTRWTSLKALDVSLWLILSLTKNARSVRPTIRATFSKAERAAIARSQRYRCMYCGVRLTTDNLQIDHMDPVSRGGSNDDVNLQALCRRCNIRKGNHTDEEFRERYDELVGNYMAPPTQTIPQRHFEQIMRSTDAHEGVREANRNRYLTPGQRVTRSLPIAIGFWAVVFTIASAFWFSSLIVQALFVGIAFGIAYAIGLRIRAQFMGIFDQ